MLVLAIIVTILEVFAFLKKLIGEYTIDIGIIFTLVVVWVLYANTI